jgi:transposase
MEQYVGLDVSLKETSLCVVDQTGTTLWQGKCASTPECIAAVLARRAPGATRIGLESGLLSTWHWHALKALGLPVVCLDARHVKAALSLRLNKTDANDAEGLAQIVRTGWYRQVQVKSLDSHLIRTLLAAVPGWWPCIGTLPTRSVAHSRPLAWGRWQPERSKPVSAN